jgi:DNA-binding SARP family transcriptional activator
MLEFRVLGAIEIHQKNNVVKFGGTVQQTLFAALLADAGTLVTVESLIEELWGTTPPAKVENALQAQVSRLRRRLGRLEPERTESRLQTSAAGYLLEVEQCESDAGLFLHTLGRVRDRVSSRESRNLHTEIGDMRDALALWRGPVFGGLIGGPLCQIAASRYEESRNVALSLLYELELRVGEHSRVLPELTALCASNPLQEQFCLLLMLALYRTGRQVDALNVYRQFRQRLVDDLGVEPSPVLQQYEKAILMHDPALMNDQLSWMTGPEMLSA